MTQAAKLEANFLKNVSRFSYIMSIKALRKLMTLSPLIDHLNYKVTTIGNITSKGNGNVSRYILKL